MYTNKLIGKTTRIPQHGGNRGERRSYGTNNSNRFWRRNSLVYDRNRHMSPCEPHIQNPSCTFCVKKSEQHKPDFVSTNCQYILKTYSSDSSLDSSELKVEWQNIFRLMYRCGSEQKYCPICLDAFSAARMAKCGHIYCYHCVIEYIAFENEKAFKKCAVCDHKISVAEMKGVSFLAVRDYQVGQRICFKKIFRNCNTGHCIVKNDCHSGALRDKFNMVLSSSTSDKLAILQEDIFQIRRLIDEESDESPFLLQAERHIFMEMDNVEKASRSTVDHSPLANTNVSDVKVSNEEQKFVEYYQVDDGQYFFLHSLNWKMLCEDYTHLRNAELPSEVRGRIVAIEEYTATNEFKKRFKYLSHIPACAIVFFVEIKFEKDLISEGTFAKFEETLFERAKAYRRKKKEERLLSEQKVEYEDDIYAAFEMSEIEEALHQSNSRNNCVNGKVPSLSEFMPLSSTDNSTVPISTLECSGPTYAQTLAANQSKWAETKQHCVQRKETLEETAQFGEQSESAVTALELAYAPRSSMSLAECIVVKEKKQRRRKKEKMQDN